MQEISRTKLVLDPMDTVLIRDSVDNEIKETLSENVFVHSLTQTGVDPVTGTITYTMWRDISQTVSMGDVVVKQGVDGTGLSIPDYVNGDYAKNETVMEDGLLYRALGVVAAGTGIPSATPALWKAVQVGGVNLVHDQARDYAVGEVILVNGAFYTPFTNITASNASPVPFVEGYAIDQWYNVAGGVFRHWGITEAVAADTVRRFGDALYQSNSVIAAGVAFAVGDSTNEWRIAGTPKARASLLIRGLSSGDPDMSASAGAFDTVVATWNADADANRITLNTATGVATVLGAGTYFVYAEVDFDRDGGATSDWTRAVVRVNDSVELTGPMSWTPDEGNNGNGTGCAYCQVTGMLRLEAGDEVTIHATGVQIGAGLLDLNASDCNFTLTSIS